MEQVIRDILQKHGIKKSVDVSELYLARKALASVCDLSGFPMLNYLWLNNNKIREIPCLTYNYRLTELYLHNNEITNITGCLNHLTSLQVLLLHKNQLRKLGEAVSELRGMQFLMTLTFFLNPFAQDPGYRLHVIYYLPSVTVLDRRAFSSSLFFTAIKQEERIAASHLFDPERNRVLQSLAFGRRVEKPMIIKKTTATKDKGVPVDYQGADGKYGLRRQQHRFPSKDHPDPSVIKTLQRSVMQFSSMDWNNIPTSQQNPLEDQPSESPQIITVKFR
ncbi:leucine-rich repeat-containing protein 72 isoform X1 [Lepisosteus oculatus]|uniref:leucine-rich repeat-containing protein 72 isoform X1 n=1 Tax=Lepisosteus oculatus TaxID=7918 RepID=UPI0035F529F3